MNTATPKYSWASMQAAMMLFPSHALMADHGHEPSQQMMINAACAIECATRTQELIDMINWFLIFTPTPEQKDKARSLIRRVNP